MSRKQINEQLVSRIGEMRARIRKEVDEELALKNEEARARGQFFWENNWMTPDESRQLGRQLKIRDKIVLLELVFLAVLMGLASYSLYFTILRSLLPR